MSEQGIGKKEMDEPVTQAELVAQAEQVQAAMCRLGLTLATAESCTGGLIGHVVTEVAGSSAYFLGGAVVYSYGAKEAVVGVSRATLLQVGAVSAEIAAQMAQGARRLYGADVAVSVTGIAGPGGGLPDKPTGTTYLHLSAAGAEWSRHYVWPDDRTQNKLESARAALDMILAYVEGIVREDGSEK